MVPRTSLSTKEWKNEAARVNIYTATALERGRVVSPTLDLLYPGKAPGTHFIEGWVEPRTSLDSKEWRKISTPRTRAAQLLSKCVAAWATYPTHLLRPQMFKYTQWTRNVEMTSTLVTMRSPEKTIRLIFPEDWTRDIWNASCACYHRHLTWWKNVGVYCIS